MRFSATTVAAVAVVGSAFLCSSVSAFAPSRAFICNAAVATQQVHQPQQTCACAACMRTGLTRLFADVDVAAEAVADVPAEVEAMDGIASADEAHNAERPARESLKKKRGPKGKALSEFAEGDTIVAKVKTITNYGAFLDIGAQTDGLLHISRLSEEYVKDVNEILKVGQDVEVRIVSIDADKNQVALSLLTVAAEERAAEAVASRPKQDRSRQSNSGSAPARRDDNAAMSALQKKGWDTEAFVEGKVVSTVTFGAFVRFNASQLNAEVEGEIDGLVHISSLSVGRADSVKGLVNVGDVVQVRCKAIEGGKVSLSMINSADEQQQGSRGSSAQVSEGAKDWKESLEKAKINMPTFVNRPIVVDRRN